MTATTPEEELRARTSRSSNNGTFESLSRQEQGGSNSQNGIIKTKHWPNVGDASHNFKKNTQSRHFELAHDVANDRKSRTSGVHKTRLKRGVHTATLVEKYDEDTPPNARKSFRSDSAKMQQPLKTNATLDVSARKRPGPSFTRSSRHSDLEAAATKSDLIRSDEAMNGEVTVPNNRHPLGWDTESEDLAKQLERVALEIINTERDATTLLRKSAVNTPTLQNFAGPDTDSEEEYVLETYVRKPMNDDEPAAEASGRDVRHVGYLILHETDEGLWDTYVESDESDGWDEEDYDSNAEDNPANDYPEEVDSDDQIGPAASEDEEYDDDHDEADLF